MLPVTSVFRQLALTAEQSLEPASLTKHQAGSAHLESLACVIHPHMWGGSAQLGTLTEVYTYRQAKTPGSLCMNRDNDRSL